jgi:hypothetical protein
MPPPEDEITKSALRRRGRYANGGDAEEPHDGPLNFGSNAPGIQLPLSDNHFAYRASI